MRNKIAPISIFFLLFISRIVVSMTTTQSLTTGFIGSDMVVSIVIALLAVTLLSVPSILCVKYNKNPFDIGWLSCLYGLYFIFLAGVNVSRFSYFASTTLNPDSQPWIFTLIVILCAFYGAYLGIEGLSRFSAFAFFLLMLATIIVLGCNIKNYDELNFYPVINNGAQNMLNNSAVVISSTVEMSLFLCLSKRVNGVAIKQYIYAIIGAFVILILLFLFATAVMGDYASSQAFPIYSLFQQAKIGGFERIDVIHVSFWILGVYVKTTLLIYCASVSFKRIKQKNSVIFSSIGTFIVAALISLIFKAGSITIAATVVPFIVFCIVIPLAVVIFKKKSFGDRLVENY
ncbi:MAG: spore germination protein [Acetobacter sp.]|nr:spore germination protein [Bacteroides sp.]MCM1340998.1 spore germination protein [Acetobacter sp.]